MVAVLPSQGLQEAKCTLRRVCLLLMQEALEFGGSPIHASLSVGIATTTDPTVKSSELRESAERAMYRAKAETHKSTPRPSAIADGDVSIIPFVPGAP